MAVIHPTFKLMALNAHAEIAALPQNATEMATTVPKS